MSVPTVEPATRAAATPFLKTPPGQALQALASLRLTVTLFALSMVLVFVGTLAQVDLGLYKAQNEFFRSFFIYWGPAGASWKIPVFPGGYLVGGVLLINLVTAHFTRFKLTRKKIGIWITIGKQPPTGLMPYDL